ncbi:RNA polymerase sigma factor [Embleya hyalina]|uniref:RNA polymerase sigma factor n=1 Tax=Embleya hyalina TaxID=516124 RepID=UPI001FE4EE37|nr:RNA polymerase sigma factor [Embleya hyalina]
MEAVRGIAGDPELLEAFYRRHIDAVGRFVARRVDDPQSAADLTVEVFIAAMGSAAAYRGGPGGELAWLYGVARNVVANERRRSAREADASRRMAGRRVLDEDDIQRLEERLDAAAEVRRTHRALARLSEEDRAVLELVSVDGMSVAEAAGALGIRPVAARVRLHRARRRLAKEVGSSVTEPQHGTRAGHVQAEAKA